MENMEEIRNEIIEGITNKIADELTMNHQKYFREPLELNKELSESLEYWEKNSANTAKVDFFNDKIKSLKDFIYLFFEHGIKAIDIYEILSFIQEPEALLNYYKEEFLNKSIEKLYFQFRTYKAYEKEIIKLSNDKSHIIHRQKDCNSNYFKGRTHLHI